MWHEQVAHRGPNDMISSLSHSIYNTRFGRTGAKWSIWWANNCAGQNKNHCVVWFFQYLIRQGVYCRIDYRFETVGHTYRSTDRCFGVIEKYLSRIENVYTPEEWYQHVKDSTITESLRVEVTKMYQQYFREPQKHLRQMYTERDKDIDRWKATRIPHVVWFNLEPVNGAIDTLKKYMYGYNIPMTFLKLCAKSPSTRNHVFSYCPQYQSPPRCESYPLPIKVAKAADLMKLAVQYLPSLAKDMYIDLPAVEGSNLSDCEDSDWFTGHNQFLFVYLLVWQATLFPY